MPPKPGPLWEALPGDAACFLFSLSSLSFAVALSGRRELGIGQGLGGAASSWMNQQNSSP